MFKKHTHLRTDASSAGRTVTSRILSNLKRLQRSRYQAKEAEKTNATVSPALCHDSYRPRNQPRTISVLWARAPYHSCAATRTMLHKLWAILPPLPAQIGGSLELA